MSTIERHSARKKNCGLVEDNAIISRIDQLIYVSAIIRYQVKLHLGANVVDRAQSALGAIFLSKLCENKFKRQIFIWIFLMKKAYNTVKTFKIINSMRKTKQKGKLLPLGFL